MLSAPPKLKAGGAAVLSAEASRRAEDGGSTLAAVASLTRRLPKKLLDESVEVVQQLVGVHLLGE